MSRLEQHYKNTLTKELIGIFQYKKASDLPSIEKIVVNCGLKSVNFNDKLIYYLYRFYYFNFIQFFFNQ